jgi:hypothetical protein
MKSKQQIYAELLQYGIVFIRNNSKNAMACHIVADFLHNIPICMLNAHFDEDDFYFLNFDVPEYVAHCKHMHISTNPNLLAFVDELRAIMPDALRARLKEARS